MSRSKLIIILKKNWIIAASGFARDNVSSKRRTARNRRLPLLVYKANVPRYFKMRIKLSIS